MKIKKEVSYAIKALKSLYKTDDLLTAESISKNEQIPINFLYPILRKLSNSRIIEIKRGKHGGYSVSKNIINLSLYDIFCIIDKPISITVLCERDLNCTDIDDCKILNEFDRIESILIKELKKILLIDLF
ncbi:Rrf2 family transcriptional regulator [Romboutsia sp. MSSM.1001216sp_RTP31141st1_G3_RTP31141_220114]|uniref:RrF2 family transcriptional regulator n=1 Tax=unclassified Romboutsia TaxID=2626894 RepID=UPI0031B628C0